MVPWGVTNWFLLRAGQKHPLSFEPPNHIHSRLQREREREEAKSRNGTRTHQFQLPGDVRCSNVPSRRKSHGPTGTSICCLLADAAVPSCSILSPPHFQSTHASDKLKGHRKSCRHWGKVLRPRESPDEEGPKKSLTAATAGLVFGLDGGD